VGVTAVLAVFLGGVFVGLKWNEAEVFEARVMAEPAIQTTVRPGANPRPILQEAQPASQHVHSKKRATVGRRLPPREPPSTEKAEVAADEEPTAVVAAPMSPPKWQVLAAQLDYDAAREALEQQGGFEAATAEAAPEQLMILHDIARATGNRKRALQALQAVVERYPDDPNAPIAAWSLGNLLEASGDQAGASQAYSKYRALSPKGDFAEDALARQVQVALDKGALEEARRNAAQYEQDFPNGRHIDELRAQLAELADAGAALSQTDQETASDKDDEQVPDGVPSDSGR
jgi:TolA-binding protein